VADLHELLKTETAGLHDRLEQLPYFRALQAGQLPKPAIVSFMRSLAIIHAVLEREISQVAHPELAELSKRPLAKVPLLIADLEAIGAEGVPSVTAAIHGALDYGAEILRGADDPWSLAGVLYVLEGSQNGGLVLQQAYLRCLQTGDGKLSYFGCYGRHTAAHWRDFGAALNALGLGNEQAKKVVESAIRCFRRLEKICTALYPYAQGDLKHHVTEVNYEAGDHAMPQDPREIDLALRAGRTAWQQYPYLEHRFGDRGRRFTSSDSCWLVALTHMPVEAATRNLEWLRCVLASRGIPTVILEGHLHAISQALAAEFAEHAGMPERYERFLAKLEAEREALGGGAARLVHLVAACDRRFRGCAGFRVASAAQLIASAWVDERTGSAGALAAVVDWFTDGERFSSDWIANARGLVSDLNRGARARC
jgi:heme oxygenase